MRLWFDLDNLPDVNVFFPIMRRLDAREPIVTTREFSGLEGLVRAHGVVPLSVGGHYGSSMLAKAWGTALRTLLLARAVPEFDASIGSVGASAVWATRLRGKKALCFLDNDLVTTNLRLSAPVLHRLFVPRSFRTNVLERLHLVGRTATYDGFKEDLAVADFVPDPKFPARLPFPDFVVVRGEALKAEYVPKGATTIVPEVFRRLQAHGVNALFLPRDANDRALAQPFSNVYAPTEPLNGLDACHFARAVLTGSGTLAREAAVLGVPAASFFPGPQLLSVDQEMIRRGWITHSREPERLVQDVLSAKRRPFHRERSLAVLGQVVSQIEKALGESSGR